MQKNIYLTGFMGTGKSTVGGLLSVRLGIPFVDTDVQIELTMGLPIDKIFAKKGGEDLFRENEREVLNRLRFRAPLVVACGGGMILSILNREVLREGIWINLKASPATIMDRIGLNQSHPVASHLVASRPLLGKKVKREEVENLLLKRQPYYELAPHQVGTDGLSPEGVLTPVLKIVLTQILRVGV
ncbi:MAG: shikimate kinase [Deltaproteobacteria bacterium]|nr:shikimate kinase [Deltaproteobacteria bacterium]